MSLGTMFTEVEQLTDVVRPFGELVALARPGERLPEPGAARIYAADEDWKEVVKQQMQAARLVIIRANVGENLLWEPKQAVQTLNPERVLILVLSMKPGDYESFCAIVKPLLGVSLPEGETLRRRFGRVSGFIAFSADWKSSRFGTSVPRTQEGCLQRVLSRVLQVRTQTRFRKVWPGMAASPRSGGRGDGSNNDGTDRDLELHHPDVAIGLGGHLSVCSCFAMTDKLEVYLRHHAFL